VWNALRALEGRWIAPDLVTAAAAPAPDDQQPEPDVLLLASQTRRYATAPTAGDIESALLAELIPEELLQLSWRRTGESREPHDTDSDEWLDVMAAAEATVPD
jgi:hypothetical protein